MMEDVSKPNAASVSSIAAFGEPDDAVSAVPACFNLLSDGRRSDIVRSNQRPHRLLRRLLGTLCRKVRCSRSWSEGGIRRFVVLEDVCLWRTKGRPLACGHDNQYNIGTIYPAIFSDMLRISKLCDYATILLGQLAASPTQVQPAADLAHAARLELPTASKVLKLLASAGLVDSYRGVAGGYRLARPADRISVADIVEAIDGPIGMTECSVHAGACSHEHHCGVRGPWQRISLAVIAVLRDMTLAEMIESGRSPGPAKRGQATERIAIRLA